MIVDEKYHHFLTPIYQKNETHCKKNMFKLTYQTCLEAGKPQQLLPLPLPLPPSIKIVVQMLLLFSTLVLAKHVIVFI